MADEIKVIAENVSSLQKDMAHIGNLVDRLDLTIEKLTEVSSTVSQLLAVQGNRLEYQEKISEKVQDLIEKRREETEKSFNEIYMDLEKIQKNLKDDMDDNYNDILKEIKDHRTDSTNQHKDIKEKYEQIDTRMNKFERWMWMIVGGAIILSWVVNKINLVNILS
jgi:chromosome segregation ATPase